MRILLFFTAICAFGQHSGQGMLVPLPDRYYTSNTFGDLALTASTHRQVHCGLIWTQDGGSKSITALRFRFGTPQVVAGGTDLLVSLQDIALSGTTPVRSDGTADQSVTIPDTSIVASTVVTATLGSSRTVSPSTPFCVVFEPANFAGSDAIRISHIIQQSNEPKDTNFPASVVSTDSGTTWTENAQYYPMIVFVFSDGSLGTFAGMEFWSAMGQQYTYSSVTGTADEYCMKFTLSYAAETDGLEAYVRVVNTSSTYEVIVYSGTTPLFTPVTPSPFLSTVAGSPRRAFIPFGQWVPLSANTPYRACLRPTTSNSIALQYNTVAVSTDMEVNFGGTNFITSRRLDQGAWEDVPLQRPVINMSIRPSSSGAPVGGTHAHIY